MTAKSDAWEKAMIDHLFDGSAASTYATLYVSLHTAAVGDDGAQNTNEATYGGYARQAVAVPAGWTTNQNQANNADEVLFPTATSGNENLTHFAIGAAASGPGQVFYHAQLTAPVNVVTDVQPKFVANAITVTED